MMFLLDLSHFFPIFWWFDDLNATNPIFNECVETEIFHL